MRGELPPQIELSYIVVCEHIEEDGKLCAENATRVIGRQRKMILVCDHHARSKAYKSTAINIKLNYPPGAMTFEEFNDSRSQTNHA